MIQQAERFFCPKDHGSLRWPEAFCESCGSTYFLAHLPNPGGSNHEVGPRLYDFRPSTPEIESDRADLEAHRKVVEGLLCFQERRLRQLGFGDLRAGLERGWGNHSRLMTLGLRCERTTRNAMELGWHILSKSPTKKVAGTDSIQSSFAGYSKSYEMISDFASPNWVGWYKGKLIYGPVILHHHQNMIRLNRYLRKWGCKEVLEFGCGTGLNLLLLNQIWQVGDGDPELSLSGFDYPVARILATKATMDYSGLKCNNIFLANGLQLPLRDASFDVVFSHYVIEQMAGYEEEALDSMLRVAKVGVVLFETAVHKPTLNQRIYMKHSGYSRRLPEVVKRRSDIIVEEITNLKQDRFFGCPNVLFALRKR